MTTRDRKILLVIALLALLGGFWFFAVKPKRGEAQAIDTKIAAQQQRLQAAEATLADGVRAKAGHARDYAAVTELGKAVPADDELTSLLYQIEATARGAHVDFGSLTRSSGGGSGAPAPASSAPSTSANDSTAATGSTPSATTAAAALPPGAVVGTAGLATLPFAFQFTGSFFQLENLISSVQDFVRVNGNAIAVRGRLLTIDGVSLVPGSRGLSNLEAKLSATAYLAPATGQGSGAAATPNGATPTPNADTGTAGTPNAAATPNGAGSSPTTTSAPTSSAISAGASQ